MPQPVPGIQLAKDVFILRGSGSPNTSSVKDVQRAGLGSLYLQTDVAGLWQCTTAAIPETVSQAFVPSVWTQIS